MSEIAEIRQVYHDATELLVRLANVLENDLLSLGKQDGAAALGLAGWLLSGLDERVRLSEGIKLVFALCQWVEEDIASKAIADGACAIRMGAQLVNTLFGGPGAAAKVYVQIRDDLICWSDQVEMNVFPHKNNGLKALRLATDLLKLTARLT